MTAEQLYRIKKGIDDQIAGQSSALNPTAAEVNRLQDSRAARDAYLAQMEGLVPEAQTARAQWAADSVPLNQMAVGTAALDALTPRNLRAIDTDRVSPTGYGNWLANERRSVEQATGARLPPNATLDDVMTSEQAATLRAVEQNMADRSAINAVNAAPGSDTVKNLNERAWLARALPPSLGGNYLAAPFERAFRGTEDQRNQLLIQALLNPNGMMDMLNYQPQRASLWQKFLQSGLGAAAGAQ
jgi:hypothetical protein